MGRIEMHLATKKFTTAALAVLLAAGMNVAPMQALAATQQASATPQATVQSTSPQATASEVTDEPTGLVFSLDKRTKRATLIGLGTKFENGNALDIPAEVTDADGTSYQVTTIGNNTHKTIFDGAQISVLTIPKTVTSISPVSTIFKKAAFGKVVFKGKRPTSLKESYFLTGTPIYYTIDFTNAGTVVKSVEVASGGSATSPEIPAREGLSYTWQGDPITSVANSGTVHAQWNDAAGVIYALDDASKTAAVAGALDSFEGELNIPAQVDGYAVTSIEKRAFAGNGKLTQADIPMNISSVGYNVFTNCTALKEASVANPAVFPDSVTDAPAFMFEGCTELANVTIPEGSLRIPSTFLSGCGALEKFTIPSSVKTIGSKAFEGCGKVEELAIPDQVSSIGTNAFDGMASLKEATLPAPVTQIPASAFAGCTALAKVQMMGNVTSIGANAFQDCSSLASLGLKEGLTSIGNGAFANSGIEEAVLPSTLTSVGQYLFSGDRGKTKNTALKAVTVKKSAGFEKSSYALAGCSALETANLDESLETLPNYCFQGCESLKGVRLPQTLQTIGSGAFMNCSSLESIDIPASVTKVMGYVFQGTGLKSVVIPSTVTSLGSALGAVGLFANCQQLEDVKFYATGAIGVNCFKDCPKLQNVVLGSGITGLGRMAFAGANVDTLTVTQNLASIDATAFTGAGGSDPAIVKNVIFAGGMSPEASADQFPATSTLVSCSLNGDAHAATIDSVTSTLEGDYEIPSTVVSDGAEYTVTGIGSKAFEGAQGITSVDIPASVTKIAEDAFGIGVVQKFPVRFFDKDGAQIGDTQYVEKGKAAETPEAPAVEGYTFKGWSAPTDAVTGAVDATAVYEAIPTPEPTPEPKPQKPRPAAVGTTLSSGGATYKVTGSRLASLSRASKSASKANVNTVRVNGITYKVTSVKKGAFKGSGAKSVTLGSNVTSIESGAFSGASKLTSVSGGKNLKSIGSRAFAGDKKLKSVSLNSTKLAKIGSSAFSKTPKLKKLVISKTAKLTKKGVKGSLKGSSIKTVDVKNSKAKAYKKLFKKSNSGKSVKVK